MAGGDGELTGPDLMQGVPPEAVAEGGMLLGHAAGEPVLLAQTGGEYFAIGAVCTHYSGPLAEGLLVGQTVRCPWHHACFDLRTGEALRAPALAPVSCWRVEKDGGRVRVIEKLPERGPAPPPAGSAAAEVPASVVAIGGGAAGLAAVEMLRREGYRGGVTMVSAEPTVPVDRPNLSKDYLAGTAPEEWVPVRPAEWYAERDIELRLGIAVTSFDTAARTVTLDDGTTLSYGALLLATGAEPVRLTIPGADLPHVFVLRTFADSRDIVAAAGRARTAVVMGASFIGLEVAASLRRRGLAVRVVAPEQRPLERVMGPDLGDFIRGLHEEQGVVFHLGTKASAIEAGFVTLEGGERLPADLVVIGVGVRPRVALAERAGLAVDGGVLVDEYLRTSVPDVYAAGDIARWPDVRTGRRLRVEHWVVAERQGQTAARNILGRRERFDAVPFFWSMHYDVGINYVGHAERWDRIDVAGDLAGRDAVVTFRDGDRIAAVATVFRDRQSLEAELALERDDRPGLEGVVRA